MYWLLCTVLLREVTCLSLIFIYYDGLLLYIYCINKFSTIKCYLKIFCEFIETASFLAVIIVKIKLLTLISFSTLFK